MNGDEILEVLKEIRDEAKQTNTRLESLQGRVEFLEKRVTKGFGELSARVETYAEAVTRRQTESELRLASAVISLQESVNDVRSFLVTKLDDHKLVIQHEERISVIESRLDDKPPRSR